MHQKRSSDPGKNPLMPTMLLRVTAIAITICAQAADADDLTTDARTIPVQEAGSMPSTPTSEHQIIKVKGMVCAFCAQGIEKSFQEYPEVLSVKVDLSEMKVHLTFKKKMVLSKEKIKAVITNAGFQAVGL